MQKLIEKIINPPAVHMVGDGFRVHNLFPNALENEYRMSPFFLLDYNSKFYFSPSEKQRGVGVHPHRGMETVSIVYSGKVAHHDSKGNSGVIGIGDVQWMTAGSGILHKEYHEKEFSKTGGDFHMVQLWVNLPKKHKMTNPKYQAFENHEIAKYILPNNAGNVEIIAGEFEGIEGNATTFSPLNIFNIKTDKKSNVKLSFPENYNTSILVAKGLATINSKQANENQLVLFENRGTEIELEVAENSILLVMSGEPIDEPIVSYGPFLMNTEQEMRKTIDDYNNGFFGNLEA
jgi:quercetin 2,3-dioxygenase